MQNVSIKTSNGTDHSMLTSTYARWLCLVEAFDFINTNAEKFKSIKPTIKTIAIQKYIDERYHAMLHDVKVEEGLYDLELYR